MVDAADTEKLDSSKSELQALLEKPQLQVTRQRPDLGENMVDSFADLPYDYDFFCERLLIN